MNIKLLNACHLLDRNLQPENNCAAFPQQATMMASEDQAQLQQCIETIAAILYRNTPPKQLHTLEGIEQALREQTQHQATCPRLGVALLQQHLKRRMAAAGNPPAAS